MADVKPAQPAASSAAVLSVGPTDNVVPQEPSKSRSSKGGGKRRGQGGQATGDHMENGNNQRRKKPELEHYKPGAFSSRKPDDEGGNHDQEIHEDSQQQPPQQGNSKRDHHSKGDRRKGNNNQIAVEQIAQKVASLNIESGSAHVKEEKSGGGNRRNRKKPEQPHYVPKKAGSEGAEDVKACDKPAKDTPSESKNDDATKSQQQPSIKTDQKPSSEPNRKKNKGRRDGTKGGGGVGGSTKTNKPEDSSKVIDETQRNGHSDDTNSKLPSSQRSNNRRGENNRGQGGNANQQDHHEENLPPRLRQKDGESSRGRNRGNHRNNRGGTVHGSSPNNGFKSSSTKASATASQNVDHEEYPRVGKRGQQFNHNNRRVGDEHLERESSSPMVSSEARSPSPQLHNHAVRRDSASSRNNRRSHSPQHNSRNSPSIRRGGGSARDSRGGRGASTNSSRRDYNNRSSKESSDWRSYDDHRDYGGRGYGGGKVMQQPPKSLAPRFQKSREYSSSSTSNWSKHDDYRGHSEWRGGHQQASSIQPRRRQQLRDYEVDDSRAYDYEKDDDDDLEPPKVTDWSLDIDEIEQEEKMLRLEAAKKEANRGGIIRLPPDVVTSSTTSMPTSSAAPSGSSGNWRAHPQPLHYKDHNNAPPPSSVGPSQHYDNENPAWRGVQQQRYLYDHKNPKKPILAQRSMRPPIDPAAAGTRFPMDPRFAPPPSGPRMPGYRPPFPSQARPTAAIISDAKTLAAEGGEAAKVLGTNELRLMAIVQTGGPQKLCQLWNQDVREARHNIMRTFKHLLQTDLVFCAKSDVEFFVWKICFYNLVATLKTWIHGGTIPSSERQVVEENVIELLEEGLDFYSEMLETLDATYRIGLERYYDVLEPRSSETSIRCALVSAQKCLLCLGDLARYKEMIQNTSNYGKARQYYQKASHIDTRNAKPFNQLAILAWTAKRKFEAVYYHMRCLTTKAPVESSRQSLVEIFEDIRKRWEGSEKKRLEERAQRKKEADSERDRMHLIKGTRLRKEIWLRPDGGRRLHRTTSAQEGAPDSEETELKEMSTTELNRRFNNAFLHLIGSLYSHINIDSFPIGCDLLQKEFRILLSRLPLPIDCKRLVQIMALNMFIIEHTKMKSGDQEHYVSVTQNYALQLAFEMFGILVERCNTLMLSFIPTAELTSQSQTIFHDDDLPNLLSAVKVWCDWLLGNNDTWYPVICDEPFNELAKLATHLEKLNPIIAPILKQCINEEAYLALPASNREEYEMIKLDEDAVLCGFAPWSLGVNWSIYRRYAPKSIPITLLQDARRLDAINFCVDYLEGLEPPILKWSPPDNAHISLVENIGSTAEKVNAKLTHMLSREQDILEESYSDDESKHLASVEAKSEEVIDRSSKIGQLKMRKEELERRKKEDAETRKLQQQILSEHVSVTLEVCPKYIIPDTNCFVDYLPEISRLATNSPFQLRVPLVVLKELDGLAKGARPAKYASPEHATMVAENARHALAFLKDRPPNTRCVTSRGTVLQSLGVTTEDDYDQDKNNDDLILDACINLALHKEEIRGNMRVVYRDLVLLTEDRNLKLKAHMTDIPVNKLSDFIHWAYSTSIVS